jgi:hypothetical protein
MGVSHYTSDEGWISKIHEEPKKLNDKRINNPINKWKNELSIHFSKEEEVQTANKCMKEYSASLTIQEM